MTRKPESESAPHSEELPPVPNRFKRRAHVEISALEQVQILINLCVKTSIHGGKIEASYI